MFHSQDQITINPSKVKKIKA